MGRPTHGGGRSPRDLPARDWIGGYRPRLRAAARPAAAWAGVDEPQPAPYLAPTLEEEMLDLTEAHPGDVAGVIFGYAGRDGTGPYVVAMHAVPFPQVEPLEGGLRVPRQSWWALSQRWQDEIPDMEPVGWFRIQPSRGTSLGSYDRFTAYQRFADPLQFTWVLDPRGGRQALYRWEGSELAAVPGYWRCSETPQVPPREPPRSRVTPVVRKTGALAGIAVLKPWLLAAAAATAVYLVLPFAPGSLTSRIPSAGDVPETPAAVESPIPLAWSGGGGGSSLGSIAVPPAPFPQDEDRDGTPSDEATPNLQPPSPAPSPDPSSEARAALARGSAPSTEVPPLSPAPAAPPHITYQVRKGETLWRISLRLLGDPTRYAEIAELNGIRDPHRLEVGQILKIPTDLDGALK